MWTLFHLLTTQSARLDYDFKLVPTLLYDFVTKIFSCRVCGENLSIEEEAFPISGISSNWDSVLWLWKIHNSVNARLQGAASEDPKVPKFQYPPRWICDDCSEYNPKLKHQVFFDDSVFDFLMEKYSPDSIKDHFLQESAIKTTETTPENLLTKEELSYLKMINAHHAEF